MTFIRLFFGYLVQIGPFAYLCFYPFSSNFRFSKKKTIAFTIAVIAGCACAFSAAGTYLASILPGNHKLFQSINFIFMLSLLPYPFWYIYAVKNIWQKKLFIFSFSLTSALAITSVCNMISTWYYLEAPSDGLPYKGYTLLFILLITLLVLPLLILLLKNYYYPIEKHLNAKESGHLSILSLLLFLILASGLSFIEYEHLFENPMVFFLFFSLLLSVFVIYLLYFKMYFYLYEKYISQNKYQKIRYDMQLLDEQYRKINDNIENSRRLRHDLRHHILTLQGYLNKNEFDKAKDYIAQYMESLSEYELTKFCDHQVVNMLIGYYYSFAQEQNIAFLAHINIPENLSLLNADIAVLLGNLLENAVTAAASAPTEYRKISLNIVCHRKMLAITMDNGFNGVTKQQKNGEYLSVKPEHIGIGLKSITDIAEKYNGGVEFKHDGKLFHSCVMLGLNENISSEN